MTQIIRVRAGEKGAKRSAADNSSFMLSGQGRSNPNTRAGHRQSACLRWQYCAEAVGLGFAQGKTMLWRREVMEKGGGIRALGAEIAEDAASTKLVHRQGLCINLVDSPFEQPLGLRGFRDVWLRQVRWARMRRKTFPLFYAPEIVAGAALPCLAAAYAASMLDLNVGHRDARRSVRLVRSGTGGISRGACPCSSSSAI